MSIIVISGKARAGKDTLAMMLQSKGTKSYFLMAYADDLKRKCKDAFNLSREQLYGNLKEVPDVRYPKSDDSFWSPREILQHVGTEAYRTIENSFWVRQLFKYVDRNNLENVIITDGRFPNEITAVKDRGGVHIHIYRDYEGAKYGKDHKSEVALDNFDCADYTVDNNGTIADLNAVAETIIKEIENGQQNLCS